jgi:hypothetical protein
LHQWLDQPLVDQEPDGRLPIGIDVITLVTIKSP